MACSSLASIAPSDGAEPKLPTPNDYKEMVAKAKLYRDSQKLIRPMFQAFQANVTAYTVSVVSQQLGPRLDLGRIWDKQAVSPELLAQIATWAKEVHDALHRTAGGRMVSEWAKKPECRDAVLGATYSPPVPGIPELKATA